jgi:hypothetical protein
VRNLWLTVETNSFFKRSMFLRVVMSRMAAVTRKPLVLSSGLNMISLQVLLGLALFADVGDEAEHQQVSAGVSGVGGHLDRKLVGVDSPPNQIPADVHRNNLSTV